MISYNEDILNRFQRLLTTGRMAHAYLFSGPVEIGKTQTALAVAKLLNCTGEHEGRLFCDQCPACLKINHRNHPDILVIDREEDEETVKISQVRDLIGRLQMRAFDAKQKVCIIRNIECLSDDASNALLKTLEEPVKGSLLILTTAVPEENLPTVVSRCHQVKFYPLSSRAIKERLIREERIDPLSAHCLGQFADGCVARARQLHADGFVKRKNELIDNIVFRPNEAYLKKILGDKPQTKEALTVLLSWFRDLIVLKSGGQREQVTHLDRFDELLKLEKSYSMDKISGIIDEAVLAMKLLGENLNIKIPFILLREKIWVRS